MRPVILVELAESSQGTSDPTECTLVDGANLPGGGSNYHNRLPEESEETTGAVDVYDGAGLAADSLVGDRWVATYVQVTERYEFLTPLAGANYFRAIMHLGAPPATWDRETSKLTYAEFAVYKLVPDTPVEGQPFTPGEVPQSTTTQVRNAYTTGIHVGASPHALIGHFINGYLVNADCTRILFDQPS